ncbi:MAG TPA: hypothetical protein QGF58_17140 [Myxococcota bacterium]|nr:hypothetical protein [Myxococcota bacterium]
MLFLLACTEPAGLTDTAVSQDSSVDSGGDSGGESGWEDLALLAVHQLDEPCQRASTALAARVAEDGDVWVVGVTDEGDGCIAEWSSAGILVQDWVIAGDGFTSFGALAFDSAGRTLAAGSLVGGPGLIRVDPSDGSQEGWTVAGSEITAVAAWDEGVAASLDGEVVILDDDLAQTSREPLVDVVRLEGQGAGLFALAADSGGLAVHGWVAEAEDFYWTSSILTDNAGWGPAWVEDEHVHAAWVDPAGELQTLRLGDSGTAETDIVVGTAPAAVFAVGQSRAVYGGSAPTVVLGEQRVEVPGAVEPWAIGFSGEDLVVTGSGPDGGFHIAQLQLP